MLESFPLLFISLYSIQVHHLLSDLTRSRASFIQWFKRWKMCAKFDVDGNRASHRYHQIQQQHTGKAPLLPSTSQQHEMFSLLLPPAGNSEANLKRAPWTKKWGAASVMRNFVSLVSSRHLATCWKLFFPSLYEGEEGISKQRAKKKIKKFRNPPGMSGIWVITLFTWWWKWSFSLEKQEGESFVLVYHSI